MQLSITHYITSIVALNFGSENEYYVPKELNLNDITPETPVLANFYGSKWHTPAHTHLKLLFKSSEIEGKILYCRGEKNGLPPDWFAQFKAIVAHRF